MTDETASTPSSVTFSSGANAAASIGLLVFGLGSSFTTGRGVEEPLDESVVDALVQMNHDGRVAVDASVLKGFVERYVLESRGAPEDVMQVIEDNFWDLV